MSFSNLCHLSGLLLYCITLFGLFVLAFLNQACFQLFMSEISILLMFLHCSCHFLFKQKMEALKSP